MDEKVISTLRDLHPAVSDPVPELPDEAPTLQRVDLEVLSKIVKRSLNNGAAPAGSGWTGDLLYALIGDKDCLSALGTLICDIINGKMAGALRDLLLSSIIIPAKKSLWWY